MSCAHINHVTLEEQSVKEHMYNVSKMSMEYGAKISLAAAGELIGVLHDMGKETVKCKRTFTKFIEKSATPFLSDCR